MIGTEERAPDDGPGPRDAAGDLIFVATSLGVLIVVVTFNVLNVLHEHVESGHPLRVWEPIVWEGSSAVYFLAAAPLILAATRRFWPLRRSYLRNVAAHLVIAVLISLVHVVAIGAMRWVVYQAVGGRYNALGPLTDWPYEFRKDLVVYALVVAMYVGWRSLRLAPAPRPDAREDVLEVRDGARRHFVPLSEVVWIEAAGNYVELHREANGLLHRASLSDMERRLDGAGFVRIHRSRLVQRSAVAAVESKSTGDFVVRLKDGRELAGSRRYRRPLLAD